MRSSLQTTALVGDVMRRSRMVVGAVEVPARKPGRAKRSVRNFSSSARP